MIRDATSVDCLGMFDWNIGRARNEAGTFRQAMPSNVMLWQLDRAKS
jgi:hypothetical protein